MLSDSLGPVNNSPTALHGNTAGSSLTAGSSVGSKPEALHGSVRGTCPQAASPVGDSPDMCSNYPATVSNWPEAFNISPVALHRAAGSSPGAISSVGNSRTASYCNPAGNEAVHSDAHGASLQTVATTGACSAPFEVIVRRSEKLRKQPPASSILARLQQCPVWGNSH